ENARFFVEKGAYQLGKSLEDYSSTQSRIFAFGDYFVFEMLYLLPAIGCLGTFSLSENASQVLRKDARSIKS
uniref:Uncharacterized protein n=1 Tax=Romanomermis culicivorax TaxID=13658 RepID=A0A915IRQ5_ROMCU